MQIRDLTPGGLAFAVSWAAWRSNDGQCYLDGTYRAEPAPIPGVPMLQVQRLADGEYTASVEQCTCQTGLYPGGRPAGCIEYAAITPLHLAEAWQRAKECPLL